MKKIILTYGCIAGFIVAAMLSLSFTNFMEDFKYAELLGYSTMIIAFSTIFIAIKTYRDNHLDGSINFLEGLKIGLAVTMIASIIYVIAWMVISHFVGEEFMAEYFQQSIEKLKASDLSASEISEQVEKMENFRELYKNPLVKMGITFLEIFPVGLLISLISAFLLKRKSA
jgi:hypothetical protein